MAVASKKKIVYNISWNSFHDPLDIEFYMIKRGGQFPRKDNPKVICGNGLFYHWKRAQELIWPDIPEVEVKKRWHKWNEMQSKCYVEYGTIVVLGPASSGKTCSAATDVLTDYYLYPGCTSIIICSTTRERLEDRIWGEIKKYHKAAQARYPWLPGHLIEGRMRLVTDARSMAEEGRDFRNGVIGVACKHGDSYVGLGEFAGIKNKRVRLIGDELSLLPRVFVDALSNLDKNPDFKAMGLGNPKDTTDALGILAEPSSSIGGWESDIDQSPGTKTWPTKRPNGVCLQLVGSDSPNLDGKLGIPIITQEQIDRDIAFYGKDSLQFTMMNEGRMPRGLGSHRVLTRQMCERFHAMNDPIWRDSNIKKIAFMDAGYGGDRCIFGELQFGRAAEAVIVNDVAQILSSQDPQEVVDKQLLHLVDLLNVPISVEKGAELPEDQIVHFVQLQCNNRGISLDDFFYEPGMRTKLTVAFARITGKTGNPVDCMGKATEREVAAGMDVKCCDFYANFITELWYRVRLVVEARQWRGMKQDVMWEFCSREWAKTVGNKIQVEPKDKMKLKTGRSPDMADAVAIGVEGAVQRGFSIAKMTPLKRPSDPSEMWKTEARAKARDVWHKRDLNYAA